MSGREAARLGKDLAVIPGGSEDEGRGVAGDDGKGEAGLVGGLVVRCDSLSLAGDLEAGGFNIPESSGSASGGGAAGTARGRNEGGVVVGHGFGQVLVWVIAGHGFGHGWTTVYGLIRVELGKGGGGLERVVVGHGGGQGLDRMIINHGFGHGWFCFSDYGPIREDLERGGGVGEVGWTCGMWMEHGMMVDGGKGGWSWDPGLNVVSMGDTRRSTREEEHGMLC